MERCRRGRRTISWRERGERGEEGEKNRKREKQRRGDQLARQRQTDTKIDTRNWKKSPWETKAKTKNTIYFSTHY